MSRHDGNAASAALTASSTSAAVADWKYARGCSVAGLMLGKVFPEGECVNFPAMYSL